MSDKTPFIAETVFRVRYAETDAMRIVHHASYVVYLEEGRSEYIRQRGTSYAVLEQEGYYLAVVDLQVRYLKAARYDDRLRLKTWLAQARSRSLTFAYELFHADTGDLLVTAQSQHICLNHAGNVVTLPASWQTWIQS